MMLAPYFSLHEFEYSSIADRLGWENFLPYRYAKSAELLCGKVLLPLREHTDSPVILTSGYRSARLNARVGGSDKSAHMGGRAADITVRGINDAMDVATILVGLNVPYDKAILEFGWVHVQVAKPGNAPRRAVYTAYKNADDETDYKEGLYRVE